MKKIVITLGVVFILTGIIIGIKQQLTANNDAKKVVSINTIKIKNVKIKIDDFEKNGNKSIVNFSVSGNDLFAEIGKDVDDLKIRLKDRNNIILCSWSVTHKGQNKWFGEIEFDQPIPDTGILVFEDFGNFRGQYMINMNLKKI